MIDHCHFYPIACIMLPPLYYVIKMSMKKTHANASAKWALRMDDILRYEINVLFFSPQISSAFFQLFFADLITCFVALSRGSLLYVPDTRRNIFCWRFKQVQTWKLYQHVLVLLERPLIIIFVFCSSWFCFVVS